MNFDKNIRCGSKFKGPNRYSRKELEKIAKLNNINNIHSKTMDQLCKELNEIHEIKNTIGQKNIVQHDKTNVIDVSNNDCSFNPEKPCGSKVKGHNRYSRKELEIVAEKCGVKDIKKKTMDILCKELATVKQKSKQKPIKIIIKKGEIPKHKTITKQKQPIVVQQKNVQSLKKKCSNTSKNAFKPNYVCENGKWKKIKGAKPFFWRHELQKLDDEKLKQVAKSHNIKDIDKKNRSVLLKQILDTQYPLVQNTTIKNKYVQKFKKVLLLKAKKNLPKLSSTTVKVNFPATQGYHHFILSKILNSHSIHYQDKRELAINGQKDLSKLNNVVSNDVIGIQNNQKWVDKQIEYQKKLSFQDQLILLSYTYAGDRLIHNYIEKSFDESTLFVKDSYSTMLFPLYIPFIMYMSKHKNNFKPDLFKRLYIQSEAQTLISPDEIKKRFFEYGDRISFKSYNHILNSIFRTRILNNDFYNELFKIYHERLSSLILNSPPLEETLIVYKGLKDMDFIDFKKNNIFTNRRYISTSYLVASATHASFINTATSCCLQKITLLKRTKCLYVYFSYYNEYEILLPPDRHLYRTSAEYKPKHKNLKTINLLVAN